MFKYLVFSFKSTLYGLTYSHKYYCIAVHHLKYEFANFILTHTHTNPPGHSVKELDQALNFKETILVI